MAPPRSSSRTRSPAAGAPAPGGASKPRAISRFIVMAMLQAARAERLGLPPKSAYSWGLNRAIFFAAAKQGFRHGGAGSGEVSAGKGEHPAPATEHREEYRLGDELAYRDPSQSTLYFTIGGETQTEKDFQRQIADRFGGPGNFDRAWKEATSVVADADPQTLASGRGFYERVYRPRRDSLRAEWSEMIGAT